MAGSAAIAMRGDAAQQDPSTQATKSPRAGSPFGRFGLSPGRATTLAALAVAVPFAVGALVATRGDDEPGAGFRAPPRGGASPPTVNERVVGDWRGTEGGVTIELMLDSPRGAGRLVTRTGGERCTGTLRYQGTAGVTVEYAESGGCTPGTVRVSARSRDRLGVVIPPRLRMALTRASFR